MLIEYSILCTVALGVLPSFGLPTSPSDPRRSSLDQRRIAREHFGNDAPWFEDRIPFFVSSDPQINDVYYYRWQIFRAHQRDLGKKGFITTEFLDDVGWQLNPWVSFLLLTRRCLLTCVTDGLRSMMQQVSTWAKVDGCVTDDIPAIT